MTTVAASVITVVAGAAETVDHIEAATIIAAPAVASRRQLAAATVTAIVGFVLPQKVLNLRRRRPAPAAVTMEVPAPAAATGTAIETEIATAVGVTEIAIEIETATLADMAITIRTVTVIALTIAIAYLNMTTPRCITPTFTFA